jgi:CheY-like chemotaxis protein
VATILVVDDEFGIAELFEAILQDEGYRVLAATNGKQALEVLVQERPDLMFLDFMMPVLDGAGVLCAMASNPESNGIPIVLMSSMPEATVAARCSGYAVFMHKPFKVSQVLALTRQLLGESNQ